MVNQISLTGMVIAATPVNDYDKRLVILTKERGKIIVFAKGARRPHSQYIAGSRPFSFGEFTMYEGKNAYNLVGLNISNYFAELATDIAGVYYGFYFLELASYFSRENIESKEVLNLLYISLKALSNKSIPNELIRHIFELKIFAINGEYPNVFQCMKCGNTTELTGFSIEKNGAVCTECRNAYTDYISINSSTFYTMQFIISTPLEKLYSFTVSKEVLNELKMVMGRWMAKYADTEFKSLELL